MSGESQIIETCSRYLLWQWNFYRSEVNLISRRVSTTLLSRSSVESSQEKPVLPLSIGLLRFKFKKQVIPISKLLKLHSSILFTAANRSTTKRDVDSLNVRNNLTPTVGYCRWFFRLHPGCRVVHLPNQSHTIRNIQHYHQILNYILYIPEIRAGNLYFNRRFPPFRGEPPWKRRKKIWSNFESP